MENKNSEASFNNEIEIENENEELEVEVEQNSKKQEDEKEDPEEEVVASVKPVKKEDQERKGRNSQFNYMSALAQYRREDSKVEVQDYDEFVRECRDDMD